VRVLRCGMQVCRHVMGEAEMGRRHSALETVAGKDHLPRTPRFLCTCPAPTEEQTTEEITVNLHRFVSRNQDVKTYPR
jgi:hypothetical protein